jgi:suppressor of ftsI
MQQELGLYGNYLVMPKDSQYRNPVDREELLILDDIQLESSGSIAPFYKEYVNQAIMGRFGNQYLINGNPDYSLTLKQGEVTRLYLTNAASVRVFTFSIPGVKMKLVG